MFTGTCTQGSRKVTPGSAWSTRTTGYFIQADAFINVLRWLWGGIEGGEMRVTPIDGPATITAISGESLACTLLADHFAAVNAILAEQEPPAARMTIDEMITGLRLAGLEKSSRPAEYQQNLCDDPRERPGDDWLHQHMVLIRRRMRPSRFMTSAAELLIFRCSKWAKA